jgi:hypothetical protein
LVAVAVDDADFSGDDFCEAGADHVCGDFRLREDDDAVVFFFLKNGEEEVHLLVAGDGVERVGDGLCGALAAADFDRNGVCEDPLREGLKFRRECGGEKECLPFFGACADDAAYVGEESHVEHAVHFIENEVADVADFDGAVFHEVEEPAGCGDYDIGAFLECLALCAVADAAVDEDGAEVGKFAVVHEAFVDLVGEFARGLKDEGAEFAVAAELCEEGKCKGCGFSGASLCGAHHVASLQYEWDCFRLDGGGFFVTLGLNPTLDRLG